MYMWHTCKNQAQKFNEDTGPSIYARTVEKAGARAPTEVLVAEGIRKRDGAVETSKKKG